MVSPVELTKLGLKARLQRLGSLKYIVIAGLLFLFVAGIEIVRYEEYDRCVSVETTKLYEKEIERAGKMKAYSEYLNSLSEQSEKQSNSSVIVPIPQETLLKILKETVRQYAELLQTADERIANTKAIEKCSSGYPYDVFRWFSWVNPIGTANAQMRIGGYSENDIRGIVIISIFVCMGIFFFLSTGALLFSKNAKVVAFSMDSVKTLLGFFIGVAMSFMGLR